MQKKKKNAEPKTLKLMALHKLMAQSNQLDGITRQ